MEFKWVTPLKTWGMTVSVWLWSGVGVWLVRKKRGVFYRGRPMSGWMAFDRRTFVIPCGTRFEGKLIWTQGDVVLENEVVVEGGFRTEGRIFVGERVHITGDLFAGGDIRVDLFSQIDGDVASQGDVYIGEGSRVGGRLSLEGDLDVGKNVEVVGGFEAKGWINTRGSIPVIIYLFIYLVELLKRGHSEEVERILNELDESQPIPISEVFLFVPKGSSLLQESVIMGNIHVGENCTVAGNFQVRGNVFVGKSSVLYGSLRATGDITVEDGARVEGTVESGGTISLGECQVGGDLLGEEIEMSPGAMVGGVIHAPGGVRFVTQRSREMEEKVGRFVDDVDMVDEVSELLK